MAVQRVNPQTIGIKTATASVQIKHDGTIRIHDRDLEGPGEYDIAGVGAHVFEGYALLFSEGIRVAVLFALPEKLEFEEGSDIDIFVFLLEDAKQITSVVKEQDPRVVVIDNEQAANALVEEDGVALERMSSYKATSGALPATERSYILLT